ncbi:MAG: response regulator transcription factor [Pedosphaera sp.]|nr:response regulator transcription factor [Pedosphaera sp.]
MEADGSQAAVGGNRKILLVDDNAVVLKALELKLSSSGFAVIPAKDGATAVSMARQENPSLVILDLNFEPTGDFSSLNWDGLNIMQWLRRVQDGLDTPIVVLSMEDPANYEQLCLAAGAAAYFQKPVDYRVFLETILQLLGDSPQPVQ